MQNKILNKINDPFDAEELAPKGFHFLMAAAPGNHIQINHETRAAFHENEANFQSESVADYKIPAFHSVELSQKSIDFNDSLSEALFRRTSTREFLFKDTDFETLSFLIRLAAGIKFGKGDFEKRQKRFYPSGGALFTTRLYVNVRNVTGLPPGIYLFNPYTNALDLINDAITDAERALLHNNMESKELFEQSNFEFLITTKPQLALRKYGEHGWKIILIEAGHLAQNLLLVGAGCGFAMLPCSGLSYSEAQKVLRTFSNGEFMLYSIVAGFSS